MAAQRRDSALAGAISTTRREADAAARRIAARQRHLITTEQLLECDFTRRRIKSWADRGRLFRLHEGVFCLWPPPFANEQLWLAAVLACGPGAVLADWAAAAHLRLTSWRPGPVDVISPGGRGRGRDGIVVHRRRLDRRDRRDVRHIPCATAARTIVDLAATLNGSRLEELLIAADSRRLIDHHRLRELAEERVGRAGATRILELMGHRRVLVRSQLEIRFHEICRRAGVPRPLVNEPVEADGRRFEIDFCWPDLRLAIEVDGYAFHGGRERANSDRDREQVLAIAGWTVHRFTADQIRRTPELVVQRLQLLIEQARRRD